MSINQDITNLPTPPNRSDSPSDFSDKADAFLAALPNLQTELNTYADEANSTQVEINLSESNASDSEQTALEWASKTDGQVETVDFSAKAYAIGGTGITDVIGAAKEWAVKSGVTVDGTEYSAKDWASSENLITEGSAKDWANEAAASASAAASTAGAVGWSAGTTYNTNDAAIGSDGNTYRSLIDNNTGNDPVTGDGTKWLNLTGAPPVEKGTLTKTFAAGESATITLTEEITGAPVVSVIKEVPQTGVTNNDWDVASDGANYTLHDTAYDTTLTPSNATGNGTFTLGTGSFAAEDVGKRIVGNGGEAILTAADGSYELQTAFNDTSTIAAGDWSMFALDVESAAAGLTLSGTETVGPSFDLSTASYDSVSFDVSGQDTLPFGIAFNTDGTKMYMVGFDSKSVHQYTLSTAFDLSTASYDNVSFSVSGQDTTPLDIAFNIDGTKMYMAGSANDSVYQYTLSTAFDISTANYDSVSFDVSGQDTTPLGITFNIDGTKMYMVGTDSNSVHQYTLSTAFDLSTASYDSVSFSVAGQDTTSRGITFNIDGTKMYMVGYDNDSVYQYTLSTAFDISTASYDSVSFDVSGQDAEPVDVAFNTDGTKMYMVGYDNDSVYQYTTVFTNFSFPTSTNHTAITTSSIDSEFWTDINSMTADDSVNDGAVYYAVSTDDRTTWSIIDDTEGVRNIVRNNGGTWEYNSDTTYGSETWTTATTNDEFSTLEEAATVTTNRMDAAQLNAVTDGNHYTLGNDLDLAITLFMADGNTNSPTSDGVSINYDANVLNQGAVLGTDYEFDKPTNDTVRIKALSNENFKVRVL